jgi:arylformamidase
MIYREYDQQGLDDQYNARLACPNVEEYLERWPAESQRVRESLECRLGVPYGPSAAETLDIFPAAGGRAPVLMFIHGGYWRAFSKNEFSFAAEAYVADGITVAVVDYALAPTVTMDEIVRQCRAALAWLHHNVAEHGGDPGSLHVGGHSAGGHLTAMMMSTDWPAFEEGLPADLIKSGSAVSGLFDLEPIRLSYLNEEVRLDEDMVRRNSPIGLAPAAAGPLTLSVGGGESDEFHRQMDGYAARWRAAGLEPGQVKPPGLDHFGVMDDFALASGAVYQATRGQIAGD